LTQGSRDTHWEVLDEDERARARAFLFPQHRQRFIAARGTLRLILAQYLAQAPADLRFETGRHGKPALAPGTLDLRFNVSHSDDLALYAVSEGREVGVDLERIREDLSVEDIARRSFSRSEVEGLLSLPPPARTSAFFACWTLKEAYLKARGEGLTAALDGFAVPIGPVGPAGAIAVQDALGEPYRWSVRALTIEEPFRAAVAAEGHGWTLRRWRWAP
jgi:4'-phosphopantetheinyl transferase